MPVVFLCESHSQNKNITTTTTLFFLCVRVCEEILLLCMQREKKNGFGRTTTMETVKNFWGKVWLTGDFMNPHAITFTILFFFSRIYSTRINRSMWARVHNIHMRASTYSNTCLHVHTHFYLNPSCKV